MSFDTKILIDKVKLLKQKINEGAFADALVGGLNTGNALMQQRIFNRNVDIEGNGFGTYVGKQKYVTKGALAKSLKGATKTTRDRIRKSSLQKLTPYQRKRVNRGRQIIHKDLELEGELRRSIEIQKINERSVEVRFNFDKAALVARGQENQITNIRNGLPGTTKGDGVKIFAFNDDEIKQTNEQVSLLVKQILT